MKKLLPLLFLVTLMGMSCTTVLDLSTTPYMLDDDLVRVAQESITYDPYADQIYYDENRITTEYRNMVKTYVHTIEEENDVEFKSATKSIGGFGKTNRYSFFEIDDIWYWDIVDLWKKNFDVAGLNLRAKAYSSNYKDWTVADTQHKNDFGWVIQKTGPARTVEGFQYYEIPMRLSYFILERASQYEDQNGRLLYTPTHGRMYYVDFVHQEGEAVTLTPDAERKDNETVRLVDEESDVFEDLKKLDDLFKAGILSEEEYNNKKAELLERI